MLGQQRAAFRQMHRPLHGALQLPDIAGPRVAEDRLRCLLRQGDRMPVQAQLVPMDEVLRQREDIFGALAERRHEDAQGLIR